MKKLIQLYIAVLLGALLAGCAVETEPKIKPGSDLSQKQIPLDAIWSVEAEDSDFFPSSSTAGIHFTVKKDITASNGKYVTQTGNNKGALGFTLPAGFSGAYDINIRCSSPVGVCMQLTVVKAGGTSENYFEGLENTADPGSFTPGILTFHSVLLAAGDQVKITSINPGTVDMDYFYITTGTGPASTSEKKPLEAVPASAIKYWKASETGGNSITPSWLTPNPYLTDWDCFYKGTTAATQYFSFNVDTITEGDYSVYMYGYVDVNNAGTSPAWEGRITNQTQAISNDVYYAGRIAANQKPRHYLLSPNIHLANGDEIRVTTVNSNSLTHLDYIYIGKPGILVEASEGTIIPNRANTANGTNDAWVANSYKNTAAASGADPAVDNVVRNIRKSSDNPQDDNNRGYLKLTLDNKVPRDKYLIGFAIRFPSTGVNNPGCLNINIQKNGTGDFSRPYFTENLYVSTGNAFVANIPKMIYLTEEIEAGQGDVLKIYDSTGFIELNYLMFVPR